MRLERQRVTERDKKTAERAKEDEREGGGDRLFFFFFYFFPESAAFSFFVPRAWIRTYKYDSGRKGQVIS